MRKILFTVLLILPLSWICLPSLALAQPDLAVVDVVAPELIFFDHENEVSVVIANLGDAEAVAVDWAVVLSTTPGITIYDHLIMVEEAISLEAGGEMGIDTQISVSSELPCGWYYVGVILDPYRRSPDRDRRNDVMRTEAPSFVCNPAPDLWVSRVQAASRGAAGETLRVDFSVENRGLIAASFDYAIYLSHDDEIGPGDTLLFRGNMELAAVTSSSIADYVLLPAGLPAGSYRLGVIADPDGLLEEWSKNGNIGMASEPVEVEEASLRIIDSWLPEAVVDQHYAWRFHASGGSGGYSFSIVGGSLPGGLSFDPALGEISGVPQSVGSSTFAVEVSSGQLSSATAYVLVVTERTATLQLATDSLIPAILGVRYEMGLAAIGGRPPYSWTAAGLPAGLAMEPAGLIQGEPTSSGDFASEVCVGDAAGASHCKGLFLRVLESGDFAILTSAVPGGRVGEVYVPTTLETVGATGAVRWSVASGRLPPGLTLAAHAGTIRGTPNMAGHYSFRIGAGDEAGLFDSNWYSIDVQAQSLQIATDELPEAEVGAPYAASLELRSNQGTGPIVWTLFSGSLPAGLGLDHETGELTGNPELGTEGRYTIGIEARDAAGASGMRAYVLTVRSEENDSALAVQPEAPGGCRSAGGTGFYAAALFALMGLLLAGRRRVAGIGAAMVLFAAPGTVWSQDWPYSAVSVDHPYELVAATPLPSINGTWDGNTRIDLPFPVVFYGQTYEQLTVSVNGLVGFEAFTANHFSNQPIPSTSAPNGILALWWDDLDARPTGAEIGSAVLGSSPNREFVVQWKNIARASGSQLHFQLRLKEGSAAIEVHYGSFTGTGTGAASVGIENRNGTVGVVGMDCTPQCGQADFPSGKVIVYSLDPVLVAEDVDAPSESWINLPFTVSGTVTNVGGEPSLPFDVIAVIADSPEEILGGLEIGRGSVSPGLDPGQTRQVSISATIPEGTPTGRDHWLSLIPNPGGVVPDAGLGRNHAPPVPVVIGEPTPILRVTGVVPAALEAALGGDLAVSVELANIGSLGAQTSYRIVLSENETISASDSVLYEEEVSIDATDSVSLERTVTIPAEIAVGSYFIGVILDPSGELFGPDIAAYTGAAEHPIRIFGNTVAIETPGLPQGRIGRPYSAHLAAVGGEGNYRWRLTGGALPPGLAMSEDGWIGGTPQLPSEDAIAGPPWNHQFSVLVRSGQSLVAQGHFSIMIDDDTLPLRIVSSGLPSAAVGFDFEAQLFAAGGSRPYRWSLADGIVLPRGIIFTTDGRLVGAPEEAGNFDLIVSVEDADGESSEASLVLNVQRLGSLIIKTYELPVGLLGESYQASLDAAGGSTPYSWEIESGSGLPGGLSLTASGVIEGVPEEIGSFHVGIVLADSSGAWRRRAFNLRIGCEEGIAITTRVLPPATEGWDYEASLTAWSRADSLRWTIVDGRLPFGLSLDEEAGIIHGTPEEEGFHRDVPFIVMAQDDAGRSAVRALSISVGPAPDVLMPVGCSTSVGGAGAAIILLFLSAAFMGLRRRLRAGGLIAALLFAGLLAGGCGEKVPCLEVVCPAGMVCSEGDGSCRCGGPSGELCEAGEICDSASGRCMVLADLCAEIACERGNTCDPEDGECKCGGTGGVVCEEHEVCDARARSCEASEVDLCEGIVCAGDEECDPEDGSCRCGASPSCGFGEVCEQTQCVAALCLGVACVGGLTCDPTDGECRCGGEGGSICEDDEVCDPGQGECLPAGSCAGIVCPSGMSCDPADAVCKCGGPGGEVCESDQFCSPLDGLCFGGDLCFGVDCPEGTICDSLDGSCRCGEGGPVCSPDEDCLFVEELGSLCSPPCSLLLQDCGDGLGCYFDEASGIAFCAGAGELQEGERCTILADCGPGMYCLAETIGSSCRYLCDPDVTYPEQGSCRSDRYCNAETLNDHGLGICRSNPTGGIRASHARVDLGPVQIGCACFPKEICLRNDGTDAAELDIVSLAGPDQAAFSITPEWTAPAPLPPGSRYCFQVGFEPERAGAHQAEASFFVDLLDHPIFVELSGTGLSESIVSETFTQAGEDAVDILFVIDDSGGMQAHHPRTMQNLESFMVFLMGTGVDYHVGVITTDGRDDFGGGILRPLDASRPRIIHRDLPDPLSTFLENADVDFVGDPIERGFWSAEKFFQPEYLADESKNAGFLRDAAHLAMVFISDEPEQSDPPVDHYLQVFTGAKGSYEMFSASSIVSTDAGCGTGGPHERYIGIAERSGGIVASFCAADWGEDLKGLANFAFGLRSTFRLSAEPVEGTITVAVRPGGTGPAAHPPYGYDPEHNHIVFEGVAIPREGDVIEVSYEAVCLP